MDLKEEEILGKAIDTYWYYVAKGRALRQFLGSVRSEGVLDVGAGSGIFSRQLLDAGFCQNAVCVDPFYEQEREERYNGKTVSFVRQVGDTPQRLALMMDVLEHVDDDVGLLREYAAKLTPGSKIVITVPAFAFLWSGHDVFLEHRRRYTAARLEKAVEEAGLRIVKTRYFFGLLFPAVALVRLLNRAKAKTPQSELKIYPAWLNRLLIGIHDVERATLFAVNKVAGLSVFCMCEKP